MKVTASATTPLLLERLSCQLSQPTSYWKGPALPPPLLPRNLILFRRQSGKALMGEDAHRRSQHSRHVLICALHGNGQVGVDADLFSLKAGQCLLILPFQSHYYAHMASDRIHWLFITFELAPDSRLESKSAIGPVTLDVEAMENIGGLLRAWLDTAGQASAPLYLGRLLHQIAAQKKSSRQAARREPPASESSELLARINRFAYSNRHRPASLDELARHLGLSSSHLRRQFRLATGRALGRYLRQIRLEYACSLLLGTTLRVGEIAERCGYDTLFTFSRAFAEANGSSPLAYRRRYRGDN